MTLQINTKIMAEIRNLTRNGETFYPLTHVDAIVSNTGSGIDDVPTQGSDNPVKSGGIYYSIYDHLRGRLLDRVQSLSDKFLHYNVNTGKIYVDTAGEVRMKINIYSISDLPRDSKLDIIASVTYGNYYFAFYSSDSFTEENYISCSKIKSPGTSPTEYEEEVLSIPLEAQYLVVSSYLLMNERVIAYNEVNENIYDKVLTEQGNFILDYWGEDGNEIRNLPKGVFFYNTYSGCIAYKLGDAGIDEYYRDLVGFMKRGQQYVYKNHIYTSFDGQTLTDITIKNSLGEVSKQFTNNSMINSIFEELWIPDAIEGDYVYKIGHNETDDDYFFFEIKNYLNPSAIRFYIETDVVNKFIGYHSFEPYTSTLINTRVRWIIPSIKSLVTTYRSFTGTYETAKINLDVVKSEKYNPICGSSSGNLVGRYLEIPRTTVYDGKYWYNGGDHIIEGYSYFVLNVQEGETYRITNVSEWDARICLAKENNSMYACYPELSSNTKQDTYIVYIAFDVTKLYINFPTKYSDIVKVEKYCLFKDDTQRIQKRWCVLGDSLSAPSTLGTLWCYTNYIAQDFNFNLNNLAVSGTGYIKTSGNFVNKSRSLTDVYDVITVFGSFNDLWLSSESGGGVIPSSMFGDVTDTGTDTIAGCIYNTIKNIRDNCPSANLGIIIPTPWSSVNNIGTATLNEYGERYSNLIENMCKKYSVPVLDLYHYSGIHPWDSYFNNKYFLNSDGCHPNTMGHYTFIYPRVKEFIKSLMK